MSGKTTKNWIKGSAKQIKFSNGGDITNLSLNLEQLNDLPAEKGYIKITVASKQEPDQYGNTHSIYENDFKPDKSLAKPAPVIKDDPNNTDDDLPF